MRDVIRLAVVAVLLITAGMAIGADLQKGLVAYDNGDYETALAECLPLAEEGDAEAQFCVGQMYANGFGVMMDDAAALKWYGLAATAGHSKAQFQLGVMYANGWGVEMDDQQAAEYYRKAAEKATHVHSAASPISRAAASAWKRTCRMRTCGTTSRPNSATRHRLPVATNTPG